MTNPGVRVATIRLRARTSSSAGASWVTSCIIADFATCVRSRPRRIRVLGSHLQERKHTMDLTLTPAEEAFRDELREWLNAHHPGPEPEDDSYGFEFRRKWQRELNTAGYAGLSWPHEYGGRGATL